MILSLEPSPTVRLYDCESFRLPSLTRTVTLKLPRELGVKVISPELELMLIPDGAVVKENEMVSLSGSDASTSYLYCSFKVAPVLALEVIIGAPFVVFCCVKNVVK